jgi:hypothetical protein
MAEYLLRAALQKINLAGHLRAYSARMMAAETVTTSDFAIRGMEDFNLDISRYSQCKCFTNRKVMICLRANFLLGRGVETLVPGCDSTLAQINRLVIRKTGGL